VFQLEDSNVSVALTRVRHSGSIMLVGDCSGSSAA
jgi:hypothetical protein